MNYLPEIKTARLDPMAGTYGAIVINETIALNIPHEPICDNDATRENGVVWRAYVESDNEEWDVDTVEIKWDTKDESDEGYNPDDGETWADWDKFEIWIDGRFEFQVRDEEDGEMSEIHPGAIIEESAF
jgi:hypothetical protein